MHDRLPAVLITLALVCSFSSGCVWRTERSVLTQTLRVTTEPPRAWVWTQDASSKQTIGPAPVEVRRTYQVTRQRFSRWGWFWTALFGGVTGGGAAMIAADSGTSSGPGGVRIGGIVMVTIAGTVFIPMLIGSIIGEVKPVVNEIVTGDKFTVGATAPGRGDAWAAVTMPDPRREIRLALPPADGDRGLKLGGLIGNSLSESRPRRGPIVAVFGVQDASKRLAADTLEQLTEYLSVQLAAGGRYRIVPRDRLRERLVDERRKSYRECYDEACQIELGKALAAQKTLSTRLLRVSDRCAITAVLYDLKSETTEAAASVDTTCSVESLLDGVRRVASQLTKPAPR